MTHAMHGPAAGRRGRGTGRAATRRRTLAGGAAGATAALLAACGAPAGPGGDAARSAAPAKLTLLESVTPDKEEAYKRALLDSLTAKTPQLTVELIVPSPAERGSKLLTMAAAGTPPDVSKGDQAYYEHFVKGIIRDLRGYLKSTKLPWNDFEPAARASFTHPTKGDVYALPNSVSTVAVFYNAAHFQKAGVPAPAADKNDAKWTWGEYADRAARLARVTGDDGAPVFGSGDLGEFKWTGPWLHKGGEWWDKEYAKSLLDRDPSPRGWQFRQDLAWKLRASPRPDDAPLTTGGFGAGRFAMVFDGTWSIDALLKAAPVFKWDLAHTPIGVGYGPNETRVNPYFPDCFAMSSDKQRDQSWRLLEHLVDEPQLRFYNLDYRNTIPPRRGLVGAFVDTLAKRAPAVNWKVLVDATQYARPQTQRLVNNFDGMKREYEAALVGIMKNEKTAQQASAELAPVLTRMLTTG